MRPKYIMSIMLSICSLLSGIQFVGTAVAADVERRLYVADRSGISVYDINNRHALLRRIELNGTSDYKGICAHADSGKLYLTSRQGNQLICVDLATEKVGWTLPIDKYPDSLAITPDGRWLYVPRREGGDWQIVDASERKVVATVPIAGKPHNTWCSRDGRYMYLAALENPTLYVVDTRSHQVTREIGPFDAP